MNDLKAILDASTASDEVKVTALKLAFEIAGPIAYQPSAIAKIGDGQFLALLMELLKVLLPILLQLLVPKPI